MSLFLASLATLRKNIEFTLVFGSQLMFRLCFPEKRFSKFKVFFVSCRLNINIIAR